MNFKKIILGALGLFSAVALTSCFGLGDIIDGGQEHTKDYWELLDEVQLKEEYNETIGANIYEYNGHYYYPVYRSKEKNYFSSSILEANLLGGYLATIGSLDEQLYINKMVNNIAETFWILGGRVSEAGELSWETKEPVNYVRQARRWEKGYVFFSNNGSDASTWVGGEYSSDAFICEFDSLEAIGKRNDNGTAIKHTASINEMVQHFTNYPYGMAILDADLEIGNSLTIPEFVGSIDGNGHTIRINKTNDTAIIAENYGNISNASIELNIDSKEAVEGFGGLCNINNGTLSNITVTGSLRAPNFSNVGTLCGINKGKINNIINDADITGSINVGGVIGVNNSNASNLTNNATITAEKYNAGGLIGKSSSNGILLDGLANTGMVEARDNTAGGAIGYLSGNQVILSESTNSGSVKAKVNNAGGICGYVCGDEIDANNLTNTGDITATREIGGIFGKFIVDGYSTKTSSKLYDSQSSGRLAGSGNIGGIIGYGDGIVLEKSSNEGTEIVIDGFLTDNSNSNFNNAGGFIGYGNLVDLNELHNEINISTNYSNVGGIAGYIKTRRYLTNCSNLGAIDTAANYAGGIAGQYSLYYSVDEKIEKLNNTGNISASSNTGGIFGGFYSDGSYKDIINFSLLENAGNIISKNDRAGGILGSLCAVEDMRYEISSSANTGNIEVGGNEAGGILGFSNTNGHKYTSIIVDCTSMGEIKGNAYLGGILGRHMDASIKKCNNNGTIIVSGNPIIDNDGYRLSYVGGYAGSCGYAYSLDNESDIEATGNCVGGIVGYCQYGVENVNNIGNIKSKGSNVGGIVGSIRISGCFNNAINSGMVTGDKNVGGIAGYLYSGSKIPAIDTLENLGNIAGNARVGGIIGNLNINPDTSSYATLTINNAANSGNITAEDMNAGGIIGRGFITNNHYVTVNGDNLTNTGNVTVKNINAGGLFGYLENEFNNKYPSSIRNSKSSGVITGKTYVGGMGGYIYGIIFDTCDNSGSTIIATGYEIDDKGNMNTYLGGYAGQGSGARNCINNVALDGKGHYVGGIFGYSFGPLENLTNNANISSKKDFVGGIAGKCDGFYNSVGSLVNNGKISGSNDVAGICGRLYLTERDFTISSFVNNGEVIATGVRVAGIYGTIILNTDSSSYSFTMADCSNNGNISGKAAVGGIIGYIYEDYYYRYKIRIEAPVNAANITASGRNAGGIIGENGDCSSINIYEAKSSGTIKALGYVGGIVGDAVSANLYSPSNIGCKVIATGFITIQDSRVSVAGGMAGRCRNVYDAINNATVEGSESFIGGIAGEIRGEAQNCVNKVDINTTANFVGGIAGSTYTHEDYGKIYDNNINEGHIIGNSYVGGIFGRFYIVKDSSRTTNVSFINQINRGQVDGNDYVGGVVGLAKDNDYYARDINLVIDLVSNEAVVNAKTDKSGSVLGYWLFGNINGTAIYENTGKLYVNGVLVDREVANMPQATN